MKTEIKKGLIYGLILIIPYLALYSPITSTITNILNLFAADGSVGTNMVNIIFIYILLDILILYGLMYVFFSKIEIKKQDKIFLYGIILLFIIVQAIFIFDRQYCGTEEYSIKYVMAFLLLASAFIMLFSLAKKYFKSHEKKLTTFWIIGGLSFIFIALDELFEFHENIGKIIESYTSYSNIILDWGITTAYFIAALLIFAICYKSLRQEYLIKEKLKENKKWLIYLGIGIFFQIIYILVEYLGQSCIEEYVEITAAFFYLMTIIYLSININEKMRNKSI